MSTRPKRFAQGVLIIAGTLDVFAGLALIFAPQWFFDNVAPFAPYNRHFLGDAGTFLLPVGVGLLLAARDPLRHRLTFAVGTGLSVLHAANHTYDAIVGGERLNYWLRDAAPLLVLAALLLGAYLESADYPKKAA